MKWGNQMSKTYGQVINSKKSPKGSHLGKFAVAFRQQIREEYELTFGLGELLSRRREELQISQSALAVETGIPQADISRIECGKANPTIKTVEKILEALDLRITVSSK